MPEAYVKHDFAFIKDEEKKSMQTTHLFTSTNKVPHKRVEVQFNAA